MASHAAVGGSPASLWPSTLLFTLWETDLKAEKIFFSGGPVVTVRADKPFELAKTNVNMLIRLA